MESITQKNPFLIMVIGNLNTRSSKWWTDNKTTEEGLKIENLLSQFSLSQVINKPTHISQNFSSCIDLLFTNQENLITDSGIHPSLHSNCHHQIIYGKFNWKIFFLPRTNADVFFKSISGSDRDKAFLDKSTEEKAYILTQTIINIMSNFIPNEIVTIQIFN